MPSNTTRQNRFDFDSAGSTADTLEKAENLFQSAVGEFPSTVLERVALKAAKQAVQATTDQEKRLWERLQDYVRAEISDRGAYTHEDVR